jgi:hypothetical protein
MGKSVEYIRPQNELKTQMAGRRIDSKALARAEAAMQDIASQYGAWMQEELDKLDRARSAVAADGLSEEAAAALNARAHDLKGLGTTYGFPLVSRLAASLGRLLEDDERRTAAPLFLVDAHLNAIKAAVRDEVRDCDHPVGRTLVFELEGLVKAYLAQRRAA